jgi:stearoyl-CoA desaturase (delta-9 desaturase)
VNYLSFFNSDHYANAPTEKPQVDTLEGSKLIPFLFLHLGCLLAFYCGWSPVSIILAIVLYWVRMFAITAFYHRYFSHRSFKTSRLGQFVFALLAMSAIQRGPLWWASHHRKHHRESDKTNDPHSPIVKGLFWSHFGWMTASTNLKTDYSVVKDWAKFPELVFLNQYDWIVPLLYAALLYVSGVFLAQLYPQWHTSGFQFLVWGFFISTVILFHGTCTINSLAHLFGSQRYDTGDRSRNNVWLALITLGEGWHNNHHRYQHTARQGFFWWEIDCTYYLLSAMAFLGLIYDLNPVPPQAYQNQYAPLSVSPGRV